METYLPYLLILAGFYVGMNIGANDAANCIGTMVGARFITFRKAALLMGVCVILGGTLQGHKVMKTVGKGIVITRAEAYEQEHGEPGPAEAFARYFPEGRLPDLAILAALLSAGIFVSLATVLRLPVSTSQAIVGGVAGVGLGVVGFQAEFFKIQVLVKILTCWVVSPLLTLILAFLMYHLLKRMVRHGRPHVWSRIISIGLLLSAAYVSFSLGANDVGNAIGPLLNRYPGRGVELALLGGGAMAVGALLFGHRVTDTLGKQITHLEYTGALAAQLSAAIGVHLFSAMGIPVSTSQAIVGAVVGIGLTSGVKSVKPGRIAAIMAGWIITPLLAAVFSMGLYRLIIHGLSSP